MQRKLSRFYLILAITVVLSFATLISGVKPAKADLMVSPLRIVFEGRDRSAEVTLINTSDKTNTYRMEWKLFRMTSKNKYEDISEDDNSDFAKRARMVTKLIRFSPRQVVIEPGGRQKIRLSLRKNSELEEGEYRAHLSFSKMPDAPELIPSKDNGQPESYKFDIKVQMSFTFPVLIRNGGIVSSAIEGVSFNSAKEDPQGKLSMNIELSRTGTNTSYGNVTAYFTPSEGGKEKQIGILTNVSVYPELDKRIMRMPLTVDSIEAGSIRVIFEGKKEYHGKVWDEKVFPVTN